MTWARVRGFVQTAQFVISTNNSTAVTLGGAVAVGDVVLLGTSTGAGTTSTAFSSTVADSLGNTYTRIGTGVWIAADSQGADAWYCIVTAAGTPTITYTPSPGTPRGWMFIYGSHFTGSGPTSVCVGVVNAQTNPGTVADALTSTAVAAPATDGALIWGVGTDDGTLNTNVIGTGFSAAGSRNATISTLDEYLVQGAKASIAATFTDATNGGGSKYFTSVISVTPAAAGSAASYYIIS